MTISTRCPALPSVRAAVLTGLLLISAGLRPAAAASKNVDLNGDGTAESPVSLTVVTSTPPIKIQNKITNKAVGQGFTFQWPSAGPGGFSSRLANGTSAGVGAIWTWETLQQVYSFTGNSCTNDICLTRTVPADSARRGPFGVPGRSLTSSGVTITNASLTSSLITFFSPPTTLFSVTSKVDQIAPGLFRYRTEVTNSTANDQNVGTAAGPFGCDSLCGNGVREAKEVCDGTDLGGSTCGSYGENGTLGCAADCRSYDTSGCFPFTCGNNAREGFEVCDGTDLNGASCDSVGGGSGFLQCRPDCAGYNVSGCSNVCGNGVREGSEACDGTDLGGESCSSQGGGGFSYSSFSSANVCASASCAVQPNGNTSTTGGALRLTPALNSQRGTAWTRTLQPVKYGFTTTFQFKITNPSAPLRADGITFMIQNAGITALGNGGGSIGYEGIAQSLAVELDTYQNSEYGDPNANHVAVQSCGLGPNSPNHDGSCGIGSVNSSLGSTLADGNTHTVTITYTPPPVGTLVVVLDGSQVLNVSVNLANIGLGGPSSDSAYVGFTSATGGSHEAHDILSWTFTPSTSAGGTLSCNSDCTFDESACTNLCGNGIREGTEECDGNDLGTGSCAGHGGGGTVSCTPSCQLDYGQCTSVYCGNGNVDEGEQCDGDNLNDETCTSLGGTGGTLGCTSSCRFDLGGCTSICGNGHKEGTEHCDGADLGGFACEDFGSTGTLACASNCDFDMTGCTADTPPCDTPPTDHTVPAHTTVETSCRVEAHPAKEISTQISVCGDAIPDGEGTCPDASPATQGTVNILVPDEDVTVGPVFFTLSDVRVVTPGGGNVVLPGQSVQLFISLINAGSSPVHNVVGTLSSPARDLDGDGHLDEVRIDSAQSAYPDGPCFAGFQGGDIDCDATPTLPDGCTNPQPFVVTFPAGHPPDVARKFELTLSYTKGNLEGQETATTPIVVGIGSAVCGNGVVEEGEDCDPENPSPGDCCSDTCQFETPGTACASDNNVCTNDTCDAAGACQHVANTATCDDANACTTNDQCQGGTCVGGAPPNCNDGNGCTDDSCNSSSGCVHTNNTASCSDGNACTLNDHCSAGHCVSGAPVVCTALDQCHVAGSCNTGTGVCTNPNKADGSACSDGSSCSVGDVCSNGTCAGGPPPLCPAALVDADVTVKQSNPTTNYGTTTDLEADKGSTSAKITFMRFKVGGIGSQHITHATLRLFSETNSTSGGRVRLTSCNWTETGLKWSNKPALGAVIATIGPSTKWQRVDVDVTGALGDADGTTCIAIDNVTDTADYWSKEAKSARPELVIETSCGCQALTGTVEADATVFGSAPSSNFGLSPTVSVDFSPVMQTYVRVRVSGVGTRTVKSARLRMRVSTVNNAESNKGGDIRLVSSSQCGSWTETGITYSNRPTNVGSILNSLGSVSRPDIVEWDVTTPIKTTKDGIYCFRIESTSTNDAAYNSLQATPASNRPELSLVLSP